MKSLFAIFLFSTLTFLSFAATEFPYVKSVNSDKLKTEIGASAITVAIERIDVPTPGNVTVVFKDDLSSEEETLLNSLITAHDSSLTSHQVATKVEIVQVGDSIYTDIGEHYMVDTIVVDLSGQPDQDGWYRATKIYPIPVVIIGGQMHILEDQVGDELVFEVAPSLIVGALISNANTSDTQIVVSPTAYDNLYPGAVVSLFNGSATDSLGWVLSKIPPSTITVENEVTQNFSAATPTYVQLTTRFVEATLVGGQFNVGADRMTPRQPLPAGVPLVFSYKKNGTYNKKVGITLSFLH